jgi:mevalonate kinase
MSGEAAVSAPGKTILFGEHAAVYGHPALVAALDHRMTVTARATSSGGGTVHLEIPSLHIVRTVPSTHVIHAVTEPGDLAILAVMLGTADMEPHPAGFHVRIESTIPSGAGFGSSAALAVAVVAACRRACGDDIAPDDIARLAVSIERHQHGRASGVDVQAVLRGGVLMCRRSDDGDVAREELPPAGRLLDAFRLFHTGAPNETTGAMVAAVRRLGEREPARVGAAFETIEAATRDGRDALVRGDGDALVPIVRRAEAALEAIGVVPPAVQKAIRAIEAEGGAAKISGAGGLTGAGAGLVLVVHPDPAWHDRFAAPAGWTAHHVRLGAQGLREELAA